MADKSFGLKQINMIGVGTPTVESSTNLVINTNGSERLRITSGGNIGIGSDSPTEKLDIVQDAADNIVAQFRNVNTNSGNLLKFTQLTNGSVTNPIFYVGQGGDNSGNAILLNNANTDMVFSTNNTEAARFTSAGNLKFPSGQGIDFSATANSSGTTTSELLDDYEEGTWTPTTNSSGYTISSSSGFYTKIGRQVTCYFRVAFSAINSSSNSSVTIQGYPFTNNSPNHIAGVCRESSNVGAVYAVQINEGNTAGGLNSYSGVANGSARTLAINETYECNITYFTNA